MIKLLVLAVGIDAQEAAEKGDDRGYQAPSYYAPSYQATSYNNANSYGNTNYQETDRQFWQ